MRKDQSEKGKKAAIAASIREAGERARIEAEARRRADKPVSTPTETAGADGPDPTRYGDWERKGVVSDF
jgi:hypothetical protein